MTLAVPALKRTADELTSDDDASYQATGDGSSDEGGQADASQSASLRKRLKKSQAEVNDLKLEVGKLRAELASAKKGASPHPLMAMAAAGAQRSSPAAPAKLSAEAAKEQAAKLLQSMSKTLSGQMAYKKSLKGGTANFAAEVPNVSMEVAAAFMGPQRWKAPKATSKIVKGATRMQIAVKGKSLRYGGHLHPTEDGFCCTYAIESQTLKVTGRYTM